MTEVLNQEQDMTTDFEDSPVEEDDGLFSDYDPAKNEDTPVDFEEDYDQPSDEVKTEKTEENSDQQVASPHDQSSFLTIKYNKEAKNLSRDEAIEYAQKGMNYDSVLGKYNALKDQEGNINEIARLAKANNMSVNEYIKNLTDVQTSFELNREVESLREQYPNSDDGLLEELARNRLKMNAEQKVQQAKTAEDDRKKAISKQVETFQRIHPDVDPTKLDTQVYVLMKQGLTMTEAYDIAYADKIKEQEKQRDSLDKISRINQENKKRSLGNTNNNGYDSDNDDFVRALFSD